MRSINQKGFSLVETIIYIGILAVVLPAMVLLLIGMTEQTQLIDTRARIEQRAATLQTEIARSLVSATAVDVTQSVFGSPEGKLVYINDAGETITISNKSTDVFFSNGPKTIQRISYIRGANEEVWLTDPDMNVTSLQFDAVRDSSMTLTGINLDFSIELSNPDSVYRSANFSASSTTALQGQTIEL